jgi:hypothetical protein
VGQTTTTTPFSTVSAARATDRSAAGEINLGQLVREELGGEVFSIRE